MKNKTRITFDNFEPNAIELLGFAKNNIVEAKETEHKLPIRYKNKLSIAYMLLDEVQEFLFNN